MQAAGQNVLMVTRESGGDRRYGLGRSLLPVVEALQARGWRVRYLCQDDLPDAARTRRASWLARLGRLPGLRNIAGRQLLLGALAERLQMGWFAATIARNDKFSAVQLHDPWLAWGFWLGCKAMGVHGVRWGVAEHGFGCYSRATHDDGLTQGPRVQRWLRRMESAILAAADWVTAPTRLSLEQLARDLALPACPAHWHAIAHAALPLDLPGRLDARSALGWSDGQVYLLGVGRLAQLKRFDLLVSSWVAVAQSRPELHLQILGGGDNRLLQQLADAAGLGERLHFAVVDDIKPYLAAADIYISTSATESFGLASLEALVAGLPCICTAVGGVPEVVGQGAWLIPVAQPALENALCELLDHPLQRAAWAQRASVHASQAAGIGDITDRYAALFSN